MQPERSRSQAPAPRREVLVAAGILIGAALVAYAATFTAPFVFDDLPAIAENPTIRHLWPLEAVLHPPSAGGVTVGGRPVLNLTLALNYAVSGTDVWSYHIVNLVIHALAGLTLFGILRRTLCLWQGKGQGVRDKGVSDSAAAQFPLPVAPRLLSPGAYRLPLCARDSTLLAFAIALLWLLHPLQTEAVTYTVQRAESQMGLFYLLTLYCFIRASGTVARPQDHQTTRPLTTSSETIGHGGPVVSGPWSCGRGFGWYALAIVFCLLGMGTKEVMVTAPIAVLLYDRAFLTGSFRACWRERWRVHGALFATWLLPAWLLPGTGGRGGTVGFGSGMAWWEYAGAQCAAIPRYLGLSFWPEPLVFDYGDALPRHGPANLAWLVLMAALLGTALIAWWRWPRAGFPGAWFLLILAPSSSVVPVATQVMAEHRMYLPLAGVLAGTVIGLWAVAGRRTLWLGLAAAVALGALTVRRNADYRSDVRLWTDTVAKRPGNARARASLAYLLARQGRLAEAIAQYEAALRAKPGFAEARVNLGNAQFGAGRVDDAIATFREALRRDPESAQAHYDLGTILARSGRFAGAIDEYGVALRLNPGNADAHNNLGNVLLQLGRASEAVSQYEEALRLVPTSADVHVNCGNALAALRRYAEARGHFEAALRLRPDDAAARAGLERLTAAGPPPDR